MKSPGRFLIVFFLIGALSLAAGENFSGLFQKANEAYRAGDYGQAASGYESLVKEGIKDANVYYNLGNVYFKQKRLGLAILHYELAKRFNPRDGDIRFNLNYTRGLLEYRVEGRKNWYFKALGSVSGFFTLQEIGVIALFFGVLLWASWIIILFLGPGKRRERFRKMALFFTLLTLGLWIVKGYYVKAYREAVVLKPEAAVRYGPSHKDQVALKLAEGLKVRVKKKSDDWYRVSLDNGETGWMNEEDLGVI